MNTYRYLKIKKWLSHYGVKNYTIQKDGTIDADGYVCIACKGLTEFPNYIQFGTINWEFDCSGNDLTSLKGAPKVVNGEFDCSRNDLTSLRGAPEIVSGNFTCYDNKLTSLRGAPKIVNKDLDCSHNEIRSVEEGPEVIKGNLDCRHNVITSLEGMKKVKGQIFR